MFYCKACDKRMYRLDQYSRYHKECLAWDEPRKTEYRVTVFNMVDLIKSFHKSFYPFHLTPCFCGLPTWQYPCPWCHGWYDAGDRRKNYGMGFDHHAHGLNEMKTAMGHDDFFLFYVGKDFATTCGDQSLIVDEVLEKGKMFEWPGAQEIWDAFGKDSNPKIREELNGSYNNPVETCARHVFHVKLDWDKNDWWNLFLKTKARENSVAKKLVSQLKVNDEIKNLGVIKDIFPYYDQYGSRRYRITVYVEKYPTIVGRVEADWFDHEVEVYGAS